jgi:RimJ/RimL family protein N-acetyltransferase
MDPDPPLNQDFGRIRPALQGRLVRLRAREEADLERLNTMFNDPAVLAGLTVTFPQPMAGIREWQRTSRGARDQLHLVIETLKGEAIGVIGFNVIEDRARTAQVGMWVGQPYWGRGYGTDALRVLCRFGFQHMNLQRISLHVYETNPGARRIYERLGFRLEGTLRRDQFLGGRHIDVHVMGLLAEEFDPEG